jgi:DNA repair exonuclease SbcCD ATPase subunit
MILRKIALENWRAHDELELEFGLGLTVIQGRNEAGKSSLVEALDWILSRDITGNSARIKGEEIRAIVPANEPTAKPKVTIEVEFFDCSVVYSKTLAEDSGKRECTLVLRREGAADEHFERTEAQAKWKQIVAADGLGVEKGAATEGGLLVAHQGESIDFLTDGSSAMRSTLGVGDDGEISLTRRLEKVRSEVEKGRKRELLLEFSPRAIDAARAGTEAATARDRLKEALDEQLKYEAYKSEIEDLRDQIEHYDRLWRSKTPELKRAEERINELGELFTKQGEADEALKDAQVAAKEAARAQDEYKTRVETIERLQIQQERDRKELESFSADLEAKQKTLDELRHSCEEAETSRENESHAWENARHLVVAWRSVYDVYEAQIRLKEKRVALDSLQNLGVALQEAEAALKNAPKAPSFEEIRSWRTAYETWQKLEAEANLSLQIELEAKSDITGRFKADANDVEAVQIGRGEKSSYSAISKGTLELVGVGVLRFRTGAKGALELKADVESAKEHLKSLLGDWEIQLEACPGIFDYWENKRREYEVVLAARESAASDLKREESRVGLLHDAQNRVADAENELAALKAEALPHEKLIPFRGLKRLEVKAHLDTEIQAENEAQTRFNRARNEAATWSQRVREAEKAFADAQNRPGQIQAAIEQRADELKRLQNDDLSDEARQAKLTELGNAALRAQMTLEECQSARREMGDGINKFKVEEARKVAVKLAEERGEIEKELVRLRTSLGHACDQDPETKLQELESKITILEPEVARHESRLRGLALLDAAIQAERLKLSRDLAGPINEKLAPYLSKLRGKETYLEFDSNGTRIERVRTKDGEATISLPFSEHSEGMKEQVAFSLRLILAQKVAKHLPSGRLPVILDDPFTQSDSARRSGLTDVLREVTPSLQIIFVTCHEAPENIEMTRLTLGEWFEDEKPKPVKKKVEKRVEKIEKIVVPEVREDAATLALF